MYMSKCVLKDDGSRSNILHNWILLDSSAASGDRQQQFADPSVIVSVVKSNDPDHCPALSDFMSWLLI